MTPSQRSLKLLRNDGWIVDSVEKYIHQTKQRKDLWGFVDLIAMKPGELPLLVQVTSGSNTAARRTKILTECRENALCALKSGFRIEVHGWRKLKKPRLHWAARIDEIVEDDFR